MLGLLVVPELGKAVWQKAQGEITISAHLLRISNNLWEAAAAEVAELCHSTNLIVTKVSAL